MNKKGRNDIEGMLTLFFGIIIFFIFISIFISSGIMLQIFTAFSVFGAVGGLLSALFILMIIFSVWEAINRK